MRASSINIYTYVMIAFQIPLLSLSLPLSLSPISHCLSLSPSPSPSPLLPSLLCSRNTSYELRAHEIWSDDACIRANEWTRRVSEGRTRLYVIWIKLSRNHSEWTCACIGKWIHITSCRVTCRLEHSVYSLSTWKVKEKKNYKFRARVMYVCTIHILAYSCCVNLLPVQAAPLDINLSERSIHPTPLIFLLFALKCHRRSSHRFVDSTDR